MQNLFKERFVGIVDRVCPDCGCGTNMVHHPLGLGVKEAT
jgi:hypothetical protein